MGEAKRVPEFETDDLTYHGPEDIEIDEGTLGASQHESGDEAAQRARRAETGSVNTE